MNPSTNLLHEPMHPSADADLDDLLKSSMEEFSLDDLLKESLAQKRDEASVKAARSIVAKGGIDPEARKSMEASIRSWEMKREWNAEADVAMYQRQFCQKCDNYHVTFLGLFQRQSHRTSKVARWVPAGTVPAVKGLQKEAKYEDAMALMCEDCARDAGYPVED